MTRSRRLPTPVLWGIDVVAVVAFLRWWESVSDSTALFVSRPSAVWESLRTWWTEEQLRSAVLDTVQEAAAGLAIALVIAVAAASLLASSKWLEEFAEPFIGWMNAFPKVTLAPLFVLIMGPSSTQRIYFVAAVVFFIPFYAVLTALRTIDPVYIDNARVMGGARHAIIREVHVPAIIAMVVSSLRVCVAFALLGTVVAQVLSGDVGIGYYLGLARQSLQTDLLISGIVTVAAISFVCDRLLRRWGARLEHWRVDT